MTGMLRMLMESTTRAEARQEGWTWWFVIVVTAAVFFLLVAAVRRRLVQPMSRTPTDTTDSWTEAGRRLPVPEAEDDDASAAPEDEEMP